MNLIDAIKSGRPYRAVGETFWRALFHEEEICLSRKALLADYEIQEPAVTITRTQFMEAARQTWEDDFDKTREAPQFFALKLANKLGLGDPK